MKVLRSIMVALAIGAASLSTAQAHDSFSIGINVGAPVHHAYPAVAYHAAPRVVHYHASRAYYPVQHVYYRAPLVVHRDAYYGGPHHRFARNGYHGGYGHHGRHH